MFNTCVGLQQTLISSSRIICQKKVRPRALSWVIVSKTVELLLWYNWENYRLSFHKKRMYKHLLCKLSCETLRKKKSLNVSTRDKINAMTLFLSILRTFQQFQFPVFCFLLFLFHSHLIFFFSLFQRTKRWNEWNPLRD